MEKRDSQRKVRMALIGAGTVANYGHLPAMTRNPDIELVGVADLSKYRLAKVKEKFGVPGSTDYHKFLRMEDLDAVSICTPVDSHRIIAEESLKAGKHVFCEKPLASTIQDCWTIVDTVRETGLVFAVDLHLRLSDDIIAVKKHLSAGDLGRLEILRFVMNWACHGTKGKMGRRRAAFMRVGGPIVDNGVHFFDLVRWLSGSEIGKMWSEGQWVEEEFEYPGHVISVSRLESGVLALVEMSFVFGHKTKDLPSSSRIEVIGSEGVVTNGILYTPKGHLQLPSSSGKRFDRAYAEFVSCVRKGSMEKSPLAGAYDGAKATEAALRALEIAVKNKP